MNRKERNMNDLLTRISDSKLPSVPSEPELTEPTERESTEVQIPRRTPEEIQEQWERQPAPNEESYVTRAEPAAESYEPAVRYEKPAAVQQPQQQPPVITNAAVAQAYDQIADAITADLISAGLIEEDMRDAWP